VPRILDDGFDPPVSANGAYMLGLRYLQTMEDGRRETPRELFRRVAWHVARAERHFGDVADDAITAWADRYYRVMTDARFLPNAPALLGAGTRQGQLFACFVLPVPDSVEGIFEALKLAALVHSKGGGTGFSFGRVRGRGAPIASGGAATGVVPILRLFDAETNLIKHGGTGWGANMAVLPCDHPDIEEFVSAKSRSGELSNFNLSVGVSERFLRAARGGEPWSLVDPVTGRAAGTVDARALLELIARNAWETGDPGLLFLDRIEAANPVPSLGTLECTNPCGEAPLLPYEACCLGGLNVARFHDSDSGGFDWDGLRDTTALAVRMMDNVVETSRYPSEAIRDATLRTRKLGIGIMGFADLLVRTGIPYASRRATALASRLMRHVTQSAREASSLLGAERGSFPAFEDSSVTSRRHRHMRNATVTSNAPNSTICMVAGCSAGIEPLFSLSYTKMLANGERMQEICEPVVAELRKRGVASDAVLRSLRETGSVQHCEELPPSVRRIFATAHEIEPHWHVRVQAAFQEHTDLGTSKTVNLGHACTPEEVLDVFVLAHELGCKGSTCYRDRCQPEQFAVPAGGGSAPRQCAT
jgi:ribonucleoside-diphosphate reductase alpha chain